MNTQRLASQNARLLKHLESGKPINVFSPAKQKLRIGYINSRISDLRKQGIPIISRWITVKDSEGERVNVKEYRIQKD